MIRAFVVLLFFQCVGEGLSHALRLPVPGAVVGMLLLLVSLLLRPATATVIEPACLQLLRNLSLLFIPAGVGIMASASTVRGDAVAVVVSVAVSTVLAIAVAALVTRALLRRQRRIAQSKRPA
ncbi:MAG: CidA/LrgA family protein [Janthinobacterium lividum]